LDGDRPKSSKISEFDSNHGRRTRSFPMLEPTSMLPITEVINVHNYPIAYLLGPSTHPFLQHCHTVFKANGYLILKQFITPNALRVAQEECQQLSPLAKYSTRYTNPYKTQDNPALPMDHPVRQFALRTNAFITHNHFGDRSFFQALHHSALLKAFLATCLGIDEIYEYADPLGRLVVNLLPPGGQHPWHFDENDFSIVLMIQTAEQGGTFEIAPFIRTPEAEHYDQVSQVLKGTSGRIKRLELEPGDLILFNGKLSLHRVTEVFEIKERYTVVFSYTQKPGVMAAPENNTKIFD